MTYEIILRDQNGNETVLESEIKDSKKHEFSTIVNGNYNTIGTKLNGANYYVRHNRIALFFDRLTVEKEPTVKNESVINRSKIDRLNALNRSEIHKFDRSDFLKKGLRLSQIASSLKLGSVSELKGLKVIDIVNHFYPEHTAKIAPKTEKVQTVETGSIGEKLAQLFAQGKISETAYLQQISLLNI